MNGMNEMNGMNGMNENEARRLPIEQSLTKRRRFKEKLCHRFTRAIADYQLVEPNDKIAVCISGGKDSMLMAKLFQNLKRHNKFPFETYKKAQELGCNKIALGHHYDDVIETNLMSMLWGGQIQTMMPKLHSTNFEGMQLIRPMYYIREEDIIAWRDQNSLTFLRCACRFTEALEEEEGDRESVSKRKETKQLISELKKTNPSVEANIFNSMHNVALDAVIAYKTKGERHHFLDTY